MRAAAVWQAMRRWGVLAGLALGRLAFGLQFQSVASAGPELSGRFGLDYTALGTLVGLFMAAGIVLSLPSGLFARLLGERAVVGAGLALMAAGGSWAALAGGASGIGWGRVLSGAGGVALVVVQGKMVADRFTGAAFLPAMGLTIGSFPIGVGLSGLLAGPLGWAGLAWAGVLPAVLACWLMLAFTGPRAVGASRGMALPSVHECLLVAVAGLVWTAYNGGYYAFLAYMPSVLAERGHPLGLSAAIMAVATWANLPAMVLAGWAAARIGAGWVFGIGTAAAAVGLAGMALTDWPVLWSILLGTLGGMQAGLIVGMGTQSARPENQAAGMGIFYTIYYAGSAGLPALCGRVADVAGDPAAALGAGAVLIVMCVPFYLLHRTLARTTPSPVAA